MTGLIITGTTHTVLVNVKAFSGSAIFRIVSHASELFLSSFKGIVTAHDGFPIGFGEDDDIFLSYSGSEINGKLIIRPCCGNPITDS